MMTPWGWAKQEYKICDGVYQVTTVSHGGILVDKSIAKNVLSPAAIERGWQQGLWYAYEQDCDWTIFAYEQPTLYAALLRSKQEYPPVPVEKVRQMARENLLLFHPDYLAEVEVAIPDTETTPIIRSDLGPLRVCSPEEIKDYANRLRLQEQWERVEEFARQCYGPTAATVEIDNSRPEYDEEGGPFYWIYEVTVKDEQGTPLAPDPSLPYWDTQMIFSQASQQEISLRALLDQEITKYDDTSGLTLTQEERRALFINFADEWISEDNYARFELPYDRYEGGIETYDLAHPPIEYAPTFYVQA